MPVSVPSTDDLSLLSVSMDARDAALANAIKAGEEATNQALSDIGNRLAKLEAAVFPPPPPPVIPPPVVPPPPPPVALAYDAQFVSVDVPASVETDSIFAVVVRFRNIGTETWQLDQAHPHIILRSALPIWGTDFIILGQGKTVAPGAVAEFKSNLRAPSTPGSYLFQWQPTQTKIAFAELSAPTQIPVTQAVVVSPVVPATPAPDSQGRRALTPGDIGKIGSIRLPITLPGIPTNQARGGYSTPGISLRKQPDGTKRLAVNYDYPAGCLVEVDIPPTSVFLDPGVPATSLPMANVTQVWGQILGPPNASPKMPAVGGIFCEDDLVWWTSWNGYWTGGAIPILGCTRLNADGTMTLIGAWTVPHMKWHWQTVLRLPKDFADAYTGGKTLALGSGGEYSIVASCSRGEALSAIPEPDPAAAGVDTIVNLISCTDPKAAVRNGLAWYANIGYWNTQPKSLLEGVWGAADDCWSTTLVSLPDVQGAIFHAKLATGRIGYDYGAVTHAGNEWEWRFHDLPSLGTVAKGADPNLVPHARSLQNFDQVQQIAECSSCVDAETRTIYVCRSGAYQSGLERPPVIDVYKVKRA